jgi:hypothetical protein
MSTRVDPESQFLATTANAPGQAYLNAVPIAPIAADPDDRWGGHALPNDHPAWMKDTLSISGRARALLAKIKPVAVRVVAFWEHRVRSIAVPGGRVSVDASGSYRLN